MIIRDIDDLSLVSGYELIKDEFKIDDSIIVNAKKGKALSIKWDGDIVSITYPIKTAFFRALSLIGLSLEKEERENVEEELFFDECGVMLDLSRNRVMTVEAIKKYATYMAKMGLNTIYLYIEDTYEVPEYPYFGYMRGRYTKNELKEIDDFCYELGIEVIPAIQTLAHMEQALKWDEMIKFRDTVDVLLADDEDTYDFIRTLIKSVSGCFRTKRIHLGMDEAEHLGTGRYYRTHGPNVRTQVLLKHIDKVGKIAEEMNLQYSIFASIVFAILDIPHRDQSVTEFNIPSDFSKDLPENAIYAYANYYNDSREHYRRLYKTFTSFTDKFIFWGGIWNWEGFSCDLINTVKNSDPALLACKDCNVRHAIASIWGDDGGECDPFYTLSGLMFFAEHMYNKEVDSKMFKERFDYICETDLDAFYDMSYFYNDFDNFNEYESYHPRYIGKRYFYADILIGLLDEDLRTKPMADYYKGKACDYKKYVDKKDKWYDKHLYIYELYNTMYKKCYVIENLKKAYDNKDKKKLKDFADDILPDLIKAYDNLSYLTKKEWYKDSKSYGYEVLDLRFGGLMKRFDTAIERINSYLNGEISVIEEFESERLLHRCEGLQRRYRGIATACYNI